MMKKDRIVFLDFDGVMDTGNYCNILHSKGLSMSDEYGTVFDPNSVANLRNIIEETGAGIVVTSSWKEFMSFMELDEMWKARHLPGFLIGTTPSVMSPDREDEILEWLNRHPRTESYVILDDLPLGKLNEEQLRHFIQVDPKIGISKEDTKRAIKIISNQI